MSPTLFGIYIDNIEECLDDVHCDGSIIIGIVLTHLLYVEKFSLLMRSHYDLGKQLKIFQDLCSKMGMIVNTEKINS